VVWDRTAFLNAADESRQLVQAFDTGDGRLLWTADLARLVGPAAGKPEISPNSGLATPTMCCDAEREYVIFPTGRLAALDRQGKLLWSKELGLPDNSYGLASSLALWRNILIVQFDQTERSVLLAFDARTGAHRWESVRESEASWSSPLLVSQAGTSRIIVAGNPNLAAYKPEDGSLAWEFPILGGEVAPSPAWYGDTVFVANMYALAAAIPLAGAEAGKPAVRWEYYDDLPDISSPLASAYGLYFCTTRGKLSCLDSATGGVLWQYDAKEEINASPLLLGRQVLVATTAGRLLAFPVQAPAKLAWTLDLGMPVQATPAWHDGRLFVRSARELIALGPK
jgi:outer membrane protein assembly factor BamB